MRKLWFDFETRSGEDIDVGTEKYLAHPEADIVLLTYAFDDDPVQAWTPSMGRNGKDCPVRIPSRDTKYYAHNMGFDFRVWNKLGPRYGFQPLPLSSCVDTMALCARYTIPQSLDEAGKVLGIKWGKDPAGKRLMKKICSPPYQYTPEELHRFIVYGQRDTSAMRQIVAKLPSDKLSDYEQQVWELTMKINFAGLPIDYPFVKRVLEVLKFYRKKKLTAVPVITQGDVQTIGQIAKIKKWITTFNLPEPADLSKETVSLMLTEGWPRGEPLPVRVEALLKLRQEFGKTSLAKYEALERMVHNGRIYDNLRYHRATTGRWGGQGFQLHNLPRGSVDDIEEEIDKFYSGKILQGNPMSSAKTLVRSAICAPKKKVFVVADYSSVENVGLSWVAGQDDVLELHRKGLDEYKAFASEHFYNVPYSEVTKEQRQVCKPIILGAGYTLGWVGLLGYAEGYGVKLTDEEAQYAIQTYRRSRPKITKFWYAIADCALYAVMEPGQTYSYNSCSFRVVKDRVGTSWLTLKLPSGRLLFYNSPSSQEDKFGLVVTHMGINPYTRQWCRMKITPGRFTENIVQAMCRDLLAEGKKNLDAAGYKIIGSVHDEVIIEADEGFTDIDDVYNLMCRAPLWAEGMPLRAEGAIVRRYQKL